ncbi:helix-turn-helix domain-containing protein [Halomarina rubra]|uniref:Helix-turn-helix domain-containing protein n=1 Tax=Halomarina rubra TaxID=2071873 RepID=A0ABD6AXU8_9EURY|nr:helix-turn-helix domain-containing protein [Halomarina rubra]
MPRAHLRVDLPVGTWVADVSTTHPDVTIRVLAVFAAETGVGLARFSGPPAAVAAALAATRAAPGVTALDVLDDHDGAAVVRFETTTPVLARAAQAAAVPLEPPVTVVDGRADLVLTLPHERLSALGRAFEEAGLSFELTALSPAVDEESVLTDRQHRLLAAAADRGYYDTPRGTSLTALAADLGLAKSSLSETLHRAEGRLVAAYLDSESDGFDSESDFTAGLAPERPDDS